MKRVLLKDVIAHLQTLPQDMEVWAFWDEGGTYHKLPSKRQGHVAEIALYKEKGKRRAAKWYADGLWKGDKKRKILKKKKVVVLEESIDEWYERIREKEKEND